jgi:hypothetical protein
MLPKNLLTASRHSFAAGVLLLFSGCSPDTLPSAPETSAVRTVVAQAVSVGTLATCPGGFPSGIVNGSFEDTEVPSGGWGIYSTAQTSWSFNGAGVEIWNGLFEVFGYESNQLAEVNVNSNGDMLWQDVCIPAGAPLTFSFAHRARGGGTETVRASLIDLGSDGVFQPEDPVLFEQVYTAGLSVWALHSGTAASTAPGTPIRIRFQPVQPGGGEGNLIDAVVFGVSTQPPPPLATGALEGPALADGSLNPVRGGQVVPLRFRFVNGSAVLHDPALIRIDLSRIACSEGAQQEETPVPLEVPGRRGLRFDPEDQAFSLVWRAPASPGSCYRVDAYPVDAAETKASWSFMAR